MSSYRRMTERSSSLWACGSDRPVQGRAGRAAERSPGVNTNRASAEGGVARRIASDCRPANERVPNRRLGILAQPTVPAATEVSMAGNPILLCAPTEALRAQIDQTLREAGYGTTSRRDPGARGRRPPRRPLRPRRRRGSRGLRRHRRHPRRLAGADTGAHRRAGRRRRGAHRVPGGRRGRRHHLQLRAQRARGTCRGAPDPRRPASPARSARGPRPARSSPSSRRRAASGPRRWQSIPPCCWPAGAGR